MTSALSYAARLKKGVDYGKVGQREYFDTDRVKKKKIEKLVNLIKKSNYIVVHTGAGISTSCGIKDFRGPKGVWTLEKNYGIKLEDMKFEDEIKFEDAIPSLTHMSLVGLIKAGKVKYIITQNIDGLHQKSGITEPTVLSELHGNLFVETCIKCKTKYTRDFDVGTIGFKKTGRKCSIETCKGDLIDSLLDWDDELPEDDLQRAKEHCKKADLSLVLGSSLRVEPANTLPVMTVKNGGKLVIVNLQKTAKDDYADMHIHATCDSVMKEVMDKLQIKIPIFRMEKKFCVNLNKNENVYEMTIVNGDGYKCVYIESVEIILPSNEKIILTEQPFYYKWKTENEYDESAAISICVKFTKNCTVKEYKFTHLLKEQKREHNVEIINVDYNLSFDDVIRKKKLEEENEKPRKRRRIKNKH